MLFPLTCFVNDSQICSQLYSCSKLEVRGTVCFFCVKRLNFKDIHHKINSVYNEHAVSHPDTLMCKQIENRCTDLTDEHRERQPLNFTTPKNVVLIEQFIQGIEDKFYE